MKAKIQHIESSFHSAHDCSNTDTGAGLKEMDEGTFKDVVLKKCPWYFNLLPIFADLTSAKPRMTTDDLDSSSSGMDDADSNDKYIYKTSGDDDNGDGNGDDNNNGNDNTNGGDDDDDDGDGGDNTDNSSNGGDGGSTSTSSSASKGSVVLQTPKIQVRKNSKTSLSTTAGTSVSKWPISVRVCTKKKKHEKTKVGGRRR